MAKTPDKPEQETEAEVQAPADAPAAQGPQQPQRIHVEIDDSIFTMPS